MENQSLICPHCGKVIQLTEALTHPIEEKLRQQFQADIQKNAREHEAAINVLKESVAKERSTIEEAARKRALDSQAHEFKDLKDQLAEKARALDEARTQELSLRKRQREIEDREKSLNVEMARKLDEERNKIREDVLTKAAEEHHLKDREKDKQLEDMRKQIEDLKRKAEQGSQQTQGEVQELELEELLKGSFPSDEILPVPKGIRGADVIQKVVSPSGKSGGTILWESKRTKAWSDGWISKLKDDHRVVKADIAIIVSSVLPEGITRIGQINGIWICDFPSLVGLAVALRYGMIQVTHAKNAAVGKEEKMELLFQYLSGQEFRHRVEAIVESFKTMKEDLDTEKRAMEKNWAKREKQIQRVLTNTSGMYGDLQGLIGTTLPAIPLLDMPNSSESDKPIETVHDEEPF